MTNVYIYQNDLFWSDRILTKVHAESTLHTINLVHTPKKYIKNTIRNRFEIRDLFLLVEQNRALYFFRPSKIQGKIQLLMVPYNGSNSGATKDDQNLLATLG